MLVEHTRVVFAGRGWGRPDCGCQPPPPLHGGACAWWGHAPSVVPRSLRAQAQSRSLWPAAGGGTTGLLLASCGMLGHSALPTIGGRGPRLCQSSCLACHTSLVGAWLLCRGPSSPWPMLIVCNMLPLHSLLAVWGGQWGGTAQPTPHQAMALAINAPKPWCPSM